jgi:hypothetical protein
LTEEKDMVSRKKTLADEDQALLKQQQHLLATSTMLPEANTLTKLDTLVNNAIRWAVKSVLEEAGRRSKSSRSGGIFVAPSVGLRSTASMYAAPGNGSGGLARASTMMTVDVPSIGGDSSNDNAVVRTHQLLESVMELCTKRVQSPDVMLELMESLASTRAFDQALEAGTRAHALLQQWMAEQQGMLHVQAQLTELARERDELEHKFRRQLERPAQVRLRELQLTLAVHNNKPAYHALDIDYDAANLALAKRRIGVALDGVKFWSHTQYSHEAPTHKAKMQQAANSIAQQSLQHLHGIPNLIALAAHLNQVGEFALVIAVGLRCEQLITEVHDEYLRRQALDERFNFLESRYLEQPELEVEYNNVVFERDNLTALPATPEQLKAYTLTITNLMTRAASIEGNDDVLREQTILAFKADTSQERWDQVRNATSEHEWSRIKQELVGYILKRDDNPTEKIELLMKDGLWKEAVAIFPSPTGKCDSGELDLLRRLWIGTEKHNPTELKNLVATVGKFLKRYFQEYRFEELYPLLDKVQRRFPNFLKDAYLQATDLLCLTILPNQYPLLINCFKDLKRRLSNDLGRPEEWEDFFARFKKTHKGKRRLVQMMTLMGDSTWDITAMIKREEDKEKKAAAKKKAATTTTTTSDATTTTATGKKRARPASPKSKAPKSKFDINNSHDDDEDEEYGDYNDGGEYDYARKRARK